MTKAIRSYPKEKRAEVIKRRLNEKKGGLGYLAAVDAEKKIRENSASSNKKEQ